MVSLPEALAGGSGPVLDPLTESLVDGETFYLINKLDLAEASVRQLENLKARLPCSLTRPNRLFDISMKTEAGLDSFTKTLESALVDQYGNIR